MVEVGDNHDVVCTKTYDQCAIALPAVRGLTGGTISPCPANHSAAPGPLKPMRDNGERGSITPEVVFL